MDRYKFDVTYDSINCRGIETKLIVTYSIECDDFIEAWEGVLKQATTCITLPDNYDLVSIVYKRSD